MISTRKEVDTGEAHYCDIANERIQKALAEKQTLRTAERALDNYLKDTEPLPASVQSIRKDILENMILGMQLIGYSVGRSGDGHYHIRKKS